MLCISSIYEFRIFERMMFKRMSSLIYVEIYFFVVVSFCINYAAL